MGNVELEIGAGMALSGRLRGVAETTGAIPHTLAFDVWGNTALARAAMAVAEAALRIGRENQRELDELATGVFHATELFVAVDSALATAVGHVVSRVPERPTTAWGRSSGHRGGGGRTCRTG